MNDDLRASSLSGGGAHIYSYDDLVSISNLLSAWREFKKGKNKKSDVSIFGLNLEVNIFELHRELIDESYKHSPYESFFVCDPKRRHIHKATVRDRLMQQVLYKYLYKLFDKHFIYNSFSSRVAKGTHFGVDRLEKSCRKITRNHKQNAYALKCDISKFFDNIDHQILKQILYKKIEDVQIKNLTDKIIESFETEYGKGLPLGNITSQIFASIYMNELDQYVKHVLQCKYYFRYADDFILLDKDTKVLEDYLVKLSIYLKNNLKLEIHPNKIEIRKISSGIDFLGQIVFPHHRRLRKKSKNRVRKKIDNQEVGLESLNSYLGVVSYVRERKLKELLELKLKKLKLAIKQSP